MTEAAPKMVYTRLQAWGQLRLSQLSVTIVVTSENTYIDVWWEFGNFKLVWKSDYFGLMIFGSLILD